MKKSDQLHENQRRNFLKQFATGAAVLGTGILSAPLAASAANLSSPNVAGADEWFNKIKGKHRMVFDVTQPHEIMPFAWPKVYMMTNAATGSSKDDTTAVVIFRHNAIPYAMNNDLWAKYKFGEMFKINDAENKGPATANPFWQPAAGTFKAPGLGEVKIGINELQDDGVLFGACDIALTVFSAVVAMGSKGDPDAIKKEWLAGILPGVQVMPSGIWAVGRAQEHGCGYCFAG
ncbi:MAG: twin-arginine translocation signal domain-containing protein [Bacteroidetes bacterium]|nr:twin-arginine translocation signal domain-containing protein [Bacteroidota bacterium]